MSIAGAVLDALRAEAATHPGSHIARAGLRIGELSGVDPESLRFCLEVMVRDTDLDPVAFDFELRPWMLRCRACGVRFAGSNATPGCPACGATGTEPSGGDELDLTYVELEEP